MASPGRPPFLFRLFDKEALNETLVFIYLVRPEPTNRLHTNPISNLFLHFREIFSRWSIFYSEYFYNQKNDYKNTITKSRFYYEYNDSSNDTDFYFWGSQNRMEHIYCRNHSINPEPPLVIKLTKISNNIMWSYEM